MSTNDSISSAVVLTPGIPTEAGSYFAILCTTAGNVEVTLTSGAKHIIGVDVGYHAYPFQVINVTAGGNTTAVATYTNLH